MEEGYRALGVMEKHLATRHFFAADRYSIADIALYAYTHLAHQCDYDLAGFPAVRAWLNRVADQPGHVAMDWHPAARWKRRRLRRGGLAPTLPWRGRSANIERSEM